ncbi:CotH kinase family protein [Flammeovirga pacifica]|uniref:Secretion system C-terminal sorting domain-containing protein n=1 Tax=Flammeovirga pacifica TaxID=915059 RepID=A0A1S1Z4D8_FLAPC|nr:CotH kinase family protein [Flammeovirga pacifica]OHX68101.1 hypothetical protein NH26_17990 [Flammeovirga pacifica]
MKTSLLTILLTICYLNCFAQCKTNNYCIFFQQEAITTIHLQIDSLDFETFKNKSTSSKQLIYGQLKVKSQHQKDSISTVSLSIEQKEGNSNYKKSIFLNFGQPHQCNVEGIYLEAINNDPTLSRKKLTNKLLLDEGIPTPRTAHATFYINNEFIGLYLINEKINDNFLQHHFNNQKGLLYDCKYGADLINDPNTYLDNDIYTLNSGKDIYKASLQSFLDSINTLHHTSFRNYIQKHFEIEMFIKTLAIEVLCGHWDNYSYNKDNYSLYFNESTNKWTYIPTGYNNTFGINYVSSAIDWANRDINHWLDPFEARILVSKILEDPEYRNLYNVFIHQYIKNTFNTKVLSPYLNQQREMLLPFVENDYLYTMEYGWTANDFIQSFEHHHQKHIDHGLKAFIDERSRSAKKQVILPTDSDLSSHWIKTIKYLPEPNKNIVWMEMNDMSYKRCLVSVVNEKGKTVKRFIYPPSASIKVEYDNFSKGTYFINAEIENQKGSWVNLPNVIIKN